MKKDKDLGTFKSNDGRKWSCWLTNGDAFIWPAGRDGEQDHLAFHSQDGFYRAEDVRSLLEVLRQARSIHFAEKAALEWLGLSSWGDGSTLIEDEKLADVYWGLGGPTTLAGTRVEMAGKIGWKNMVLDSAALSIIEGRWDELEGYLSEEDAQGCAKLLGMEGWKKPKWTEENG